MFTVVTGFFDIGRENWTYYKRSREEYLNNFKNLLSLKVDMVIFVQPKNRDFVEGVRRSMWLRHVSSGYMGATNKTTIVDIEIVDLYMYRYINDILRLQCSDIYLNHPNPKAPEISQPLYPIITCSKMELVDRATNLVKSDYFIWLDAGYTHGKIDLSAIDWNPTRLLNNENKINVIALQPLENACDDPLIFFNQYIDVVIGGFFSGNRYAIQKVRRMYYDMIDEIFKDHKIIDDDQFYNTLLAKRHPELFNLNFASWYDAIYFN